MKVAITALGTDLQAKIDPRFGRAQNFIIIDSETKEFEVITNDGMNAAHGAGIQSGQLMSSKDVSVVITGQVGPNAYDTLTAADLKIYHAGNITIEEAIDLFNKGELQQITQCGPAHGGM